MQISELLLSVYRDRFFFAEKFTNKISFEVRKFPEYLISLLILNNVDGTRVVARSAAVEEARPSLLSLYALSLLSLSLLSSPSTLSLSLLSSLSQCALAYSALERWRIPGGRRAWSRISRRACGRCRSVRLPVLLLMRALSALPLTHTSARAHAPRASSSASAGSAGDHVHDERRGRRREQRPVHGRRRAVVVLVHALYAGHAHARAHVQRRRRGGRSAHAALPGSHAVRICCQLRTTRGRCRRAATGAGTRKPWTTSKTTLDSPACTLVAGYARPPRKRCS